MKFRRMSFVLCMLLFLVSSISAYAAQCELGVSLGEKGAGIELSVYKVADIEDEEYVWLQGYEGVNVDLSKATNAVQMKDAAEKLHKWSVNKNIQPEQRGTTRPDGSVSFSVSSGVYVLAKVSERGTMPPILLILPEDQLETYIMISPKFSDSDEPGKPGDDDPDDEDEPKNPGDDDPGDKEPGDKEPGGKEPSDKEPGDKEPGGKEPGDKGPVESAKTGDSANVWLWSAVLAVALVGIAVVVKKNHGRR